MGPPCWRRGPQADDLALYAALEHDGSALRGKMRELFGGPAGKNQHQAEIALQGRMC